MKNRSSLNTRMREFVPLVTSRITPPVMRPYRKQGTHSNQCPQKQNHKHPDCEGPPWQARWWTRWPIGSLPASGRWQCSCRAARWRCWSRRWRRSPRPRGRRIWEELPNPAPCRHAGQEIHHSSKQPGSRKHRHGGRSAGQSQPQDVRWPHSASCKLARDELNYCLNSVVFIN